MKMLWALGVGLSVVTQPVTLDSASAYAKSRVAQPATLDFAYTHAKSVAVQPASLDFAYTHAKSRAVQPATLDFAYYQENVEPIFLEKKAGFTRCVVCHSEGGSIGFLEELSPGSGTWTDEQSRRNFEAVSRLVTPGDPLASRLLMHPLEPEAGGDEFHNGGRQFASQDDPWFKTLETWVLGDTGR